jgi:hypothetical protein
LRWVLGFCLGTALSAAFSGILIWANGVGPPPLTDYRAVAAYPTGSMATTLEAMSIFYFLSFVLVFCWAWTWRKAFRRQKSQPDHMQDRQPTAGR